MQKVKTTFNQLNAGSKFQMSLVLPWIFTKYDPQIEEIDGVEQGVEFNAVCNNNTYLFNGNDVVYWLPTEADRLNFANQRSEVVV